MCHQSNLDLECGNEVCNYRTSLPIVILHRAANNARGLSKITRENSNEISDTQNASPSSFRTQFSRLMGSISPRLMESKGTGRELTTAQPRLQGVQLQCSKSDLHLLRLVENPTYLDKNLKIAASMESASQVLRDFDTPESSACSSCGRPGLI